MEQIFETDAGGAEVSVHLAGGVNCCIKFGMISRFNRFLKKCKNGVGSSRLLPLFLPILTYIDKNVKTG